MRSAALKTFRACLGLLFPWQRSAPLRRPQRQRSTEPHDLSSLTLPLSSSSPEKCNRLKHLSSTCRYEGGGVNRPITLVATPKLHFVEGGVFPNPNSDGTTLRVSAEIEDLDGGPRTGASHVVSFALRDEDGAVVATANQSMRTSGRVVLKPATKLSTWSPQTPVSYTLTARVGADELNLTTAARVGRHDIIPSGIWVALFSRCQRYRC